MSADALLSKLNNVRQVSAGRWRARCPAHDGKNANVLSVAATDDGTTLIKCFAGCSAAEVVAAVGLELHDLFPPVTWQATGAHHTRPACRPRVDWPALILACERDLLLVKIMLTAIAAHEPIDDDDATAALAAATRVYTLIQEARDG